MGCIWESPLIDFKYEKRFPYGRCRGAGIIRLRGRHDVVDPKNLIQIMLAEGKD
jgi:hypothetical protein